VAAVEDDAAPDTLRAMVYADAGMFSDGVLQSIIANRVVVMNRGQVYMDDTPDHVFAREEDLRKIGLGVPVMTRLVSLLNRECFDLPMGAYTVDKVFGAIRKKLGGGGDAS